MAAFLGTALGAAMAGAATGAVLSSVLAPDPPEMKTLPKRKNADGTEMTPDDYADEASGQYDRMFNEDGSRATSSTEKHLQRASRSLDEADQNRDGVPDVAQQKTFGTADTQVGLSRMVGGKRPTMTSYNLSQNMHRGLGLPGG